MLVYVKKPKTGSAGKKSSGRTRRCTLLWIASHGKRRMPQKRQVREEDGFRHKLCEGPFGGLKLCEGTHISSGGCGGQRSTNAAHPFLILPRSSFELFFRRSSRRLRRYLAQPHQMRVEYAVVLSSESHRASQKLSIGSFGSKFNFAELTFVP